MDIERDMQRYKPHKEVYALKIAIIEHCVGGALFTAADKDYGTFEVSSEYVKKYSPQAGGYYVVYRDGHESWSPGLAFEDGHTLAG